MEIDINGKAKLYQPYDMPGWIIIGTVKTGPMGVGALARNTTTGEFGQINAGVVRRLDGRKVQSLLGGMGRPVGPPRSPFERRLRELMEAAGITSYTDLAEKSSVGRATIDRACRGETQLSPLAAKALARALEPKNGENLIMDKKEFVEIINTLKTIGWANVATALGVTEAEAANMQFKDPSAYYEKNGLGRLKVTVDQLRDLAKAIKAEQDIAKFNEAEKHSVNILHLRGLPKLWLSFEGIYMTDVLKGREVTREVAETAPRLDSDLNVAWVRDPENWETAAPLAEVFA